MSRLQIYRRWLCLGLAIVLLLFGGYVYFTMRHLLPDTVMIYKGETLPQFLHLCSVSIEENVVQASKGEKSNVLQQDVHFQFDQNQYTFSDTGSYTASYQFLGLISLKNVEVDVVEEQKLIPCGRPIGIYVETEGVMIIGTSTVHDLAGNEQEPARNIVKSGDYIVRVNGSRVSTKEELVHDINKWGSKDLVLAIRRNGEEMNVKLRAVQTGLDEYKLGIWIRDNTQGVGMLTYRKEDGSFGALGHGITDVDTGLLMQIEEGKVFQTEIISIVKGQTGTPGELVGMIDYNQTNRLGIIEKNTEEGIFGHLTDSPVLSEDPETALPVGRKQEVEKGKAFIQTYLNGKLRQYEIEIQDIDMTDRQNKGMVIKVTDSELLQQTGGIVQGMSGSPIIQNGKLIGAVTHVFVNDPTRGYGIFLEEMLRAEK